MDAKEAHAKAKERNTNVSDSQYARAKKQIEKYALDGKYQCWFYEKILDDVRVKLTLEGFQVGNNQSDRDGTMAEIKW
jgi:hypothetical protein